MTVNVSVTVNKSTSNCEVIMAQPRAAGVRLVSEGVAVGESDLKAACSEISQQIGQVRDKTTSSRNSINTLPATPFAGPSFHIYPYQVKYSDKFSLKY